MAPKQTQVGGTAFLDQTQQNGLKTDLKDATQKDDYVYKINYVWRNIIVMSFLHLGSVYGMYLILTGQTMLLTVLFSVVYLVLTGTSITAGAHRLWSHKSYKAKWPLRLFLAYLQAGAFQNHIYEWVRDHRVHHKFCDTNADPHNSKRGFFFSHIGWLLVRKHRDVIQKGQTVDVSDLEKDWVVMLQKKHYAWLMPAAAFVIPSMIPMYLWGETRWVSIWVAGITRYVASVNATWLVNSAAHMWGDKPYDKTLTASNNSFVGFVAVGEGWHNYHHAFPWDYKASELWNLNWTTGFINFFSKIGWAYDLKEASDEMIRRRAARIGDGSAVLAMKGVGGKVNVKDFKDFNPHEGELWGYDDKDMSREERNLIKVTKRK